MDGAEGSDLQFRGGVNYTNPSGRVIEEHDHGAGAEFGLAVASSVLSVLYTPFRFVYGVVGAELGGVAGWTTGGDMRTAKGIWRPTTEGHYYVRPDYLDGTERFRFNGGVPPGRMAQTVESRQARVVATQQPMVVDVPPPRSMDAAPFEGTAEDPM
jgi:hypothetical protein